MTNKINKFKNFCSNHVHIQSLDTASTPEAFIKKELELGTGYITCTDHGTMGACDEVYELAKKAGIKPILGLESYFRDDNCDILEKHGIQKVDNKYDKYNKYYHLTLHAQDNDAYEALVKTLSKADSRAEQHGSERKPLFDWNDLRFLGQFNITATSSCLIGMVARHLIGEDPQAEIAKDYYTRLKSIFKPGNFYMDLYPHRCTHYWVNGVFINLEGGEKLKFWKEKQIRTTYGEMTVEGAAKLCNKGIDLGKLLAIKKNRKFVDCEPKQIISVQQVEDFMPNECTAFAPDGDLQLSVNKFIYDLAKSNGDKLVIADDAHFANPEDKIVQDSKLSNAGGSWKFANNYHRYSSDEAWDYFKTTMGMSQGEFEGIIDNTREWASKFDNFKFKERASLPTKFYPTDTLTHIKTLIDKHGRMDYNNPAMVSRLNGEIELLHNNGKIDLLPYFFLAEEICSHYESLELITGPGRGSAAGLLLTYLLGICHVNALEYDLSQNRFITIDRIRSGKFPDIDMDFPDRDPLVGPEGYIWKRFGDHAAAISTRTMLRLKSSIKDVSRHLHGHVLPELEELCKKIPNPPQGIEDVNFIFGYKSEDGKEVKGLLEEMPELQAYTKKFPADWALVQKYLGITRGYSRHASGFIIANEPIDNWIPIQTITGVRCTQYDAESVERRGGIKMDFLGLNSLNDLSGAIKLIQERNGGRIKGSKQLHGVRVPGFRIVSFEGQEYDIWKLPIDQTVCRNISEGKTETVFQLNTSSAQKWLKLFNEWKNKDEGRKLIDSIEAIAAFTSLDRPGPLDAEVKTKDGKSHNMLVEYTIRAKGGERSGEIEFLSLKLAETFGVMTYQEQIEKVYQELTGCDGIEATKFRTNIGKKKMEEVNAAYPKFMERACTKVDKATAQAVWDQICTFGQYGFNRCLTSDVILPYKDGFKPIKDFKPGDTVFGLDSAGEIIETEVVELHDHGELEAFEVEFDDGYKVTCSMNHKFLTDEGMKPLHEILEKGLEILSVSINEND